MTARVRLPHRASEERKQAEGGRVSTPLTGCAWCGGPLPPRYPSQPGTYRKFCCRLCQDRSTGAARRARDPGYAAAKARAWRANPPPRTDEQIAADRARKAANERRRRARKIEVIRLKGLCGSRVVTLTARPGSFSPHGGSAKIALLVSCWMTIARSRSMCQSYVIRRPTRR